MTLAQVITLLPCVISVRFEFRQVRRLSYIFRSYPHVLQANAVVVTQIRPGRLLLYLFIFIVY